MVRKAAQLGYAPAMLNLGIMYRYNRLPHEARQSSELAASIGSEKAALLDDSGAMGELGRLLWDRNRDEAVKCVRACRRQGQPKGHA